jgi:hypothetical protein
MRFRKLRIAWSVACAVACVLLIVLWVRSHWARDIVSYSDPNGCHTTLGSNRGYVYVVRHLWIPDSGPIYHGWGHGSGKATELQMPVGWSSAAGVTKVVIPNFGILPAIVIAAFLPWLRLRFTLRTLLIATTLVAVVLGLVIYAANR